MNIVKLQDIYRYVKLTHINPLHPYTLTMRKQKEKLRKKIPFTIVTKRIKYLEINLPTETKDL